MHYRPLCRGKTAQELGATTAAAMFIAAAYYPGNDSLIFSSVRPLIRSATADWSVDSFPPESLDYSRFDILNFAFAVPNSSSTLTWDDGSQDSLQRLVSSARSSGQGTKIVLSVGAYAIAWPNQTRVDVEHPGGWGGSTFFSQAVSTAANRATFVSALSGAVSTFGLDGIDIDWEYPNQAGAGNPFNPSDSANLLLLLTSLRAALGTSKIISAAVTDLPWVGSDGNPLTDMSAYAAQMTYANLMNYDIFGDWSPAPGPNAPLGNLCGTSTQPQYSAEAAFSQWTAAKFPASKLLLGLPLYGYVLNSTNTFLTGSFRSPDSIPENDKAQASDSASTSNGPVRGANKRPAQIPVPKPEVGPDGNAAQANLQSWWGQQIPFSSLVSSGALTIEQLWWGRRFHGGYVSVTMTTEKVNSHPFRIEGWDDCSDTPFLFNTSQQTVVSYDDTFSLSDKAAFAKSSGMAGCFTWSLDQDDGVTLQDAIRTALGK
ncbi:Glycoside hydrolase family 18 protein [Mycena sanguinolenta]|uniref:Glycoside hydrolase family 18 protein n=1 Tax=Mycena sanguinolenta TaxID=230812 RepID=A0A8H6Y1U4_9AGAR|nr:Glycoside hydrolase family 18 protein [Mycena sanguinolenta]